MNNKGFTLVEILAVIAILAILVIITVPAISNVSDNIKKSTLKTKIENIEKAAVLYGQEHRENFTDSTCTYCTGISDCNCYSLEYDGGLKNGIITVSKLLNPSAPLTYSGKTELGVDTNEKPYLEADNSSGNIINPLNNMSINTCEIQIYQKYGKVYAVYIDKKSGDNNYNTKCGY